MASVSYLSLADSIVPGPAPISPFVPGTANLFPKMSDRINETAWELWYFDGLSSDGQTAFAIAFFRDAVGVKQGGFRVQVHALWPDEARLSTELFFPESIVTETEGRVKGTWQSEGADGTRKAAFDVAPDLSTATLTLDVPSTAVGSVTLTAVCQKPILPASEDEAKLGPNVYYVRPLPIAGVVADLTFPEVADKHQTVAAARDLRLTREDRANGGMDRFWTPFAWPQLMTESFFLRANVGPYRLHVMRILSTAAMGKVPSASARLYKDNQVVCAAQDAVAEETDECDGDYVIVKKVDRHDEDAVRGQFRDRNVGYSVEFVQQEAKEKKHWKFEVRHLRGWWNMPTSAPGPNGTGNSGFLDSLRGGLVAGEDGEGGEIFEGCGGSGQVELP